MGILLARHGQTDWNIARKVQGTTDIPLNETGISQAHELYDNLLKEKMIPVKIYTSYQKRAAETAYIVGRHSSAPVKVVNGLEEMNLGKFEGHTWREINELYPMDLEKWISDKRYNRAPQGECYQDVLIRFFDGFDEILSDCKTDIEEEKNILIISHGAVIMALLTLLKDLDFKDSFSKIEVPNAKAIKVEPSDMELIRRRL